MGRRLNKIYDFMTIVSDDSVGEIWIHGDIVDDAWWDNDVSPKVIRDALADIGPVGTLNIRVNSYGGSVIAGNAIINILDSYKRKNGTKIHAYIEGIAASMGSGIPMVADYIYMAENAMFMIHKPYSVAIGNSDDFAHEQEVLEKVEDTLIVNYMRHFNGSEDELRQMMADETWLTADEALGYGFCDEIIPAIAVAASAKGININGIEFSKSADVMKDKFKENKGESTVFVYDDALAKYGVDESMFATLNMEAESVSSLANTAVSAYQNYVETNGWIYDSESGGLKPESWCDTWESNTLTISNVNWSEFISKDMVKDALGEELDAETVLNLAKQGKEFDVEAQRKAKAYDKMVSDAIDKAIASGIKAKGDEFKESKWKKILSSLEYDEIVDQMHEWDAEAKIAVKAGIRTAEPWEDSKKNKSVNQEDYKFF